jgi:hypothetical protein
LYDEEVPIRTLSPDLVISTMSSSESLETPFVLEFEVGCSFLLFSSHLASGWMVTWSTDFDVPFKIELTYLERVSKMSMKDWFKRLARQQLSYRREPGCCKWGMTR